MLITFIINLICAVSNCEYHHENPSDPLKSQRQISQHGFRRDSGETFISYPQIEIKNGVIEGYTMYTIKERPIYAFEGIPFAESTAKQNRFKPPIPKTPWMGILDTKSPGPKCIQCNPMSTRASGSENCLFLNVYTPDLSISRNRTVGLVKSTLLPVFVYIHGGAFFFSEGSHYGPAYLLDEDVLLVTINYRLGLFGFLSTGDKILPGNLGFKDQALALKWVYENIEAFGGNPKLVTIIGLSSGAISVHLHMMSNLTRNYFSGAISLSGTAFNPGTIMSRSMIKKMNRKLGFLTRCPYSDIDSFSFVECLQRRNPYILAAKLALLYESSPLRLIRLGAVIENPMIPNAFLTQNPDEIYKNGQIARVPWISTRTTHEGNFGFQLLKAFRQEFRLADIYAKYAPTLLQYNQLSKNLSEITKRIFEFYFGSSNLTLIKDFSKFGDMSTDRDFGYGLHKSLQAHSTLAPTYSYLYGFKGRNSVSGVFRVMDEDDGIVHADDLNSIFNMSRHAPGYKTTDREYAIVKLLCNLFGNFARKRVPVYTTENGNEINIWEPVTDPKNIRMLQINNNVKMIPEPEPDKRRYKFWESLGLEDFIPWIRM